MLTDGPSPFKPRRAGDSSTFAIAIIVVAATIGLYALFERYAPPRTLSAYPASAAALSRAPVAVRPPQREPLIPSESQGAAAAVQPSASPARTTIYLCKSYAGEAFWSSAVCSTQRATIDRMTNVPGHLSFREQVAIASGEADAASRLHTISASTNAGAIGGAPTQETRSADCAWLDREIIDLDRWARQLQSGQSQDSIRERRMKVMADRLRHGC